MRYNKKTLSAPEVDMTPMIDMVFQLIAFFMVISNFEQSQADERVILPKDAMATPPIAKRENELVIQIGFIRDPKSGQKLDPDPFVFYNEKEVRMSDFEPILLTEKAIYKDQDKDIKDVTLVVRADADTPTGVIQELIKMAQKPELGFEKFAIKAMQKVE